MNHRHEEDCACNYCKSVKAAFDRYERGMEENWNRYEKAYREVMEDRTEDIMTEASSVLASTALLACCAVGAVIFVLVIQCLII